MNTQIHDTPRVYVACLAAYNAGKLHGDWVDATDADELQEGIDEVLKNSPIPNAEEHAFHDFENFGGINLGPYTTVEDLTQLGALIEEHGAKLVAGVIGHYGSHYGLEAVEDTLSDKCIGVYASLGDYAEQMYEGVEIPDKVAPYVNWEGMGRDWEINGDIFTVEIGDDLHIFSNR